MQVRTPLRLLHHLARPARGGAAAVVVVFAFLLFIAIKARFIGIPLALLALSWFFKYAYVLFDHTVRGFDEPPALDIQMMNPVDEQRPLVQVALLGLSAFAVIFTRDHLGSTAAAALTMVCLFFLPASVAILGLESNPFKAAYPPAWFSLVRGLGILYGAVLLLIVVYGLGLKMLWSLALWLPIETAIGFFCVLSVFSFLGGACHERRHELNLETWVSPERTAELKTKQTLPESDKHVLEAYGLMRAGSHIKSWEMLEAWLKSRGNSPEDYHWLCELAVSWDDPRYVTRLTEEHVAPLAGLKRNGEALDVVTERLKLDPKFRPKSAATTWGLAQLAARGGGAPRVARALLSDFAARFPDDPHLRAALMLKDHLSS